MNDDENDLHPGDAWVALAALIILALITMGAFE
jgi:hypothetical protein